MPGSVNAAGLPVTPRRGSRADLAANTSVMGERTRNRCAGVVRWRNARATSIGAGMFRSCGTWRGLVSRDGSTSGSEFRIARGSSICWTGVE